MTLPIYDTLRHNDAFQCHALAGKENNRVCYTLQMQYADFVNYFSLVPYDPNADLLLQRETQASRINAIYEYTKMDYAALPACGAIAETLTAESSDLSHDIVKLTLPADAFRYLFDGQGRLCGIKKLLESYPEYAKNTVTIKLYQTQGVLLDNQLFADWNGSGLKPNQSIRQSMDSRVLISNFTKQVLKTQEMTSINQRIDYTKASVTLSQSPKLWSLYQFTTFVQLVLGVTAKSAEKLLAEEEKQAFWKGFITKYFAELLSIDAINDAVVDDNGAINAKEDTIIGTSVWLKSMAVTGKMIALYLMENTQPGAHADWSFISKLKEVDFSKANAEWTGRCMDYRGRFQDKGFNHKAMAAHLLSVMEIPLPEELEVIEDEVLVIKSENRKLQREAQKQETQLTLENVA